MHAPHHLIGALVVVSLGATACSSGGANPTGPSATRSGSTTAAPAALVTSAPSTPVTTSGTSDTVGSTSSAPSERTVLPAPDGRFSVGVTDLPMPGATAFYPASTGTGDGPHRYLDPMIAARMGGPADTFASLTTTSRRNAVPLPTKAARPVVVVAPGFGSVIALSTALAEHLASNGYVVIAVQSDVASEAATMPPPTPSQAAARFAQIRATLDLIDTTAIETLVGPIDRHRVAVGGHSYAGSVAFNVSLHDPRVAAVFDLDGRLFDEAATTPTGVPTLVVTSSGSSTTRDPMLRDLVAAGAHTVAVGLLDAQHFDLTDAGALGGLLTAAGVAVEVGGIGAVGTTDTSIIVQRFLDAALADAPTVPSASQLVQGLASTTADPFRPAASNGRRAVGFAWKRSFAAELH